MQQIVVWLPEQALQEVREAGAAWERQAQEAAAQLERLKDLLEESALWRREQPPGPEASPPNPPGVTLFHETSAAGSNSACVSGLLRAETWTLM